MGVNGAWIKGFCVLCEKTYNILHSCHNFPADSRQAARGARICVRSLLLWGRTAYKISSYWKIVRQDTSYMLYKTGPILQIVY